MQLDPILPLFVGTILTLTVVGVLVRLARQPLLIGYVLSGFVLGPSVLKVITDVGVMSRLVSIGLACRSRIPGAAMARGRRARRQGRRGQGRQATGAG